jgi:hypothetical protein
MTGTKKGKINFAAGRFEVFLWVRVTLEHHCFWYGLLLRILAHGQRTKHVKGWPEPYIYGGYTVFLAGKSPNIRSYTVHMNGSGQP